MNAKKLTLNQVNPNVKPIFSGLIILTTALCFISAIIWFIHSGITGQHFMMMVGMAIISSLIINILLTIIACVVIVRSTIKYRRTHTL